MLKKLTVTFLIVALGCGAVFAARSVMPKAQVGLDERAIRRSKGSPKAPVWVVEYMDFQCPSCRYTAQPLKDYFAKYPSRIYLQVRFFPIQSHPHGLRSAVYAECAAEQGKFWDFYDWVLDKQPEWSPLKSIDGAFQGYAKSVGLNVSRFRTCADNPATLKKIEEEKEKAKALGVNLTPTFFVGGKMVSGVKPAMEAIEKAFSNEK